MKFRLIMRLAAGLVAVLSALVAIKFIGARKESKEYNGYVINFNDRQSVIRIHKNGAEVMRIHPNPDYISVEACNGDRAPIGNLTVPVDGIRSSSAGIGILDENGHIEYHSIFASKLIEGDSNRIFRWGKVAHTSNSKEPLPFLNEK